MGPTTYIQGTMGISARRKVDNRHPDPYANQIPESVSGFCRLARVYPHRRASFSGPTPTGHGPSADNQTMAEGPSCPDLCVHARTAIGMGQSAIE